MRAANCSKWIKPLVDNQPVSQTCPMVRGSRVAAAYVGRFRLSHGGYWVGHRRFYHPQHEWAGYERALVDFLQLTFCIGAAVAVGSSLALALRWRVAASASVVVCWVGLVLGGAVYLNSVAEGPQYFDRYVGEMHFRIPGQHGPSGSDSPGPNGFYVSLCVDSLLATYDKACREGKQVSVYPPKLGFAFEELSWQRRQNAMKQAGVRGG
jgi:hypothetical protein